MIDSPHMELIGAKEGLAVGRISAHSQHLLVELHHTFGSEIDRSNPSVSGVSHQQTARLALSVRLKGDSFGLIKLRLCRSAFGIADQSAARYSAHCSATQCESHSHTDNSAKQQNL